MRDISKRGKDFEILEEIKGEHPSFDRYRVKCKCGTIFMPLVNNVNSGKTKSCGKGICHAHFIDLKGRTFDYLTAIRYVPETLKWIARCVCGKEIIYYAAQLTSGHNKSCGCKSGEMWSKKSNKREETIWGQIFNTYKGNAQRRNLSFNLSFDIFKELCSKECFYCGKIGSNKREVKTKYITINVTYNGLDRYNNKIGYEKENVVPCCYRCNFTKNDSTIEGWENWINSLIKHNKKTKNLKLNL